MRRDVWTLSDEDEWHQDIAWYERGVAELQKIEDAANPRSWTYLANIHGTFTPRNKWPPGSTDETWNQCQHASWYFLPWHRIYLHHFEKIVRSAITGLGGPATWSLPFWNYDPTKPSTLHLPPAFRQRTTPRGGGGARDNALYVARRDPDLNGGDPLDVDDVDTTGWVARFAARSASVTTFGGTKSRPSIWGPGFGQVEREPHGPVHMAIGGDDPNRETGGLMRFPQLAARDPIFWLHHANVDRLWEVWRNDGNRNTGDADWRTERFTMGTGDWETKMKVEDVLETTAAPLLYRYEGVAVPERPARRLAAPEAASEPPDEEVIPELIAASDTSTPVKDRKTVRAKRSRRRGVRAAAQTRGDRRVYLALENVVAEEGAAGRYAVHVNLPDGAEPRDHRELRAGKISTFGLEEYPRTEDDHEAGATFSFDITEIVGVLEKRGDWEADDVRVTVTPRGTRDERARGALRIGRVGVYYE